ncbi:MAG: hypothetical protein REI95_06715 [Oxalicibacterium faecigallinarum]|uniref:Uncharacterized protein n=1 Tax=Oxalicibacterium faecigallinarum TaxID=573741 RepID=A0A8J3F3N3_9BURK|nr:hypothetical protein [Oxalicibacterium faecigallinarum]MDQ7969320.1 hypothetical protein [Oxalicibacterium faecigallinarum]GGI19464.1 hypothetical protein GCM10008066_19210 [Oxalicibacterium faecigallinarum]
MSAKEKNPHPQEQTAMPEAQVSTDRHHDDRQGMTPEKGENSSSPRLPHEHDESFDSQRSGPRDDMRQAHDDIESGQIDTDRRGMPGVEEVRRDDNDATQKSLPESSRKPSSTPKE